MPAQKHCPLPVNEEDLPRVWKGGIEGSSGQINSWELEALYVSISNLDNVLGMFPVFYMTVEHSSEGWPWGVLRFCNIKVFIMFSIYVLSDGTQFRKKYRFETKRVAFNWRPYIRYWLKAWALKEGGWPGSPQTSPITRCITLGKLPQPMVVLSFRKYHYYLKVLIKYRLLTLPPEFLIQQVWSWVWEYAFLKCSRVMLMLLVQRQHFENHCLSLSKSVF